MSSVTAPATAEDVRRWCDRARMRMNSPLRLALLVTTEATIAARDVAGDARGLTPDGERELVQRVAQAAALGAERETLRLSCRLTLRIALELTTAAVLLLAVGYALGHWEDITYRDLAHRTAFLTQVAELNDISALRQHCEKFFEANGRRACALPSIWIQDLPRPTSPTR